MIFSFATRRVMDGIVRLSSAPPFVRIRSLHQKMLRRFDAISVEYRRAFAVALSVILHLGLLLLLLPVKTGLSSIGTTGLGSVNGLGMAVTLVEASQILPPQVSNSQAYPSEEVTSTSSAEATETSKLVDQTEPSDESEPSDEAETQASKQTVSSDSKTPSDSTAAVTAGAHGQDGQANIDLWNAIAPCWNKVADKTTLSATLTISFTDTGELSIAPVIERNPDAPITRQSLRSEAKALAALSECGAYPMVKGQQNIRVTFPAPLLADSSH